MDLICSIKSFSRSSVACEISAETESSCTSILPPSHRLSFFTKTEKSKKRERSIFDDYLIDLNVDVKQSKVIIDYHV